jgi:hypothetical protein
MRAATTLASLLLPALTACAQAPGSSAPPAPAAPPAEAADWTPLFNGTDLSGWTVKCKPADREKGFWRVEQGAIVAHSMGQKGHNYVWLVSDREHADFALRLKFQAYKRSPGNSGVQIRSRYDDTAGWLDGPQIDIHPPQPWRTGMMWDETRGVQRWIFPDVPKGKWVDESMSVPARVFRHGDAEDLWNEMEVTAKGLRVTAVLNGVTITDLRGEGILDDEAHRKRNVGVKGHIALQIHSGDQLEIRFKDLALRELAP